VVTFGCVNLQDSLASHAQTFVEKLSQTVQQLVRLLDSMLVSDDVVPPGDTSVIVMVALCNRADHYIFAL